ncbi:MAG: LLM class F420-dependent oxidoreductase [Actinomycetota bacterium]|nr:LLM class F420-dependent oxidoreductase [Actinomycetota bacterium]
MPARLGMSVPLEGVALGDLTAWARELAALGYTDAWSSEASGFDAFVPLAVTAAAAPELRLGTAIVPVYTRGPATLAMSAAALASLAPGRFTLGVGTSSDVIVERWNGIPFTEPYKRARDMLRFLREALAGEKVDQDFETFSVHGFRLDRVPEVAPRLVLAALRPGMLQLAGRDADGVVINWLSAGDVPKIVVEVVHGALTRQRRQGGAGGQGEPDGLRGAPEVVCRIYCCPSEDTESVRTLGRKLIAAYLNVDVYARFQEWLGRGEVLRPMWEAWSVGDRAAATAAIPDEVVDDLIVHGTPEACREHIGRYVENGVTTPVIALLPWGIDQRQAIRDLAPTAG